MSSTDSIRVAFECNARAYTARPGKGQKTFVTKVRVPLADVAVEVHADASTHGLLGLDDVPPGYTDVQYTVSVTSPAPTEDILRVLDI
jgi:hypothetical protein